MDQYIQLVELVLLFFLLFQVRGVRRRLTILESSHKNINQRILNIHKKIDRTFTNRRREQESKARKQLKRKK